MAEFGDESFDKLKKSQIFLSLYSDGMHKDHLCALQLGYAIMLDKPIYFVQMPGAKIPENLKKVARGIAVVDPDDPQGMEKAAEELVNLARRHGVINDQH